MATTKSIEKDFKAKVCDAVSLDAKGLDRYEVMTPFMTDDGDHLVVVLKKVDEKWVLSDEGHTYMYLSYRMDEKDYRSGNRGTIISDVLSHASVEDREGELVLPVPDDRFGDALYTFLQTLTKVTDISYLSREVIHSTFMEDFHDFFSTRIRRVAKKTEFDWHDPAHDPNALYRVDCRVERDDKTALVFALSNDSQVRDAIIAISRFEAWGIPFEAVGVFEDQAGINRNVLARFSDVGGKQFSNLQTNRERMEKYFAGAAA